MTTQMISIRHWGHRIIFCGWTLCRLWWMGGKTCPWTSQGGGLTPWVPTWVQAIMPMVLPSVILSYFAQTLSLPGQNSHVPIGIKFWKLCLSLVEFMTVQAKRAFSWFFLGDWNSITRSLLTSAAFHSKLEHNPAKFSAKNFHSYSVQ